MVDQTYACGLQVRICCSVRTLALEQIVQTVNVSRADMHKDKCVYFIPIITVYTFCFTSLRVYITSVENFTLSPGYFLLNYIFLFFPGIKCSLKYTFCPDKNFE